MTQKNKKRILIIDALRGFSIFGILIVHSIFHFNNLVYPTDNNSFFSITDPIIKYLVYGGIVGKANGIFSLLFGFSFFLQMDSQLKKGNDFTWRFLWRIFLLFLFGLFNSMFFTGDILVTFSILAVFMPLLIKLETKTLYKIAFFLFLNPVLLIDKLFPDYIVFRSLESYYKNISDFYLANGTFSETMYSNLVYGKLQTLIGSWNTGFFLKILGFFIVGIIIGRKELFLETDENKENWKKLFWTFTRIFLSFLLLFFVLAILKSFFDSTKQPIDILWATLMPYFDIVGVLFVLGIFFFLYNKARFWKNFCDSFIPCGKMSLTSYVAQSIIGSTLFYHWGFNLAPKLNITYSFILAIVIFFIQNNFNKWWLKSHKQGILEAFWKKLTWINFPKI